MRRRISSKKTSDGEIPPNRQTAFRVIYLVVFVSFLFVVDGCASHRTKLPECKGPFTPINQSPVTANDPQR